jgi:hypothetical protein
MTKFADAYRGRPAPALPPVAPYVVRALAEAAIRGDDISGHPNKAAVAYAKRLAAENARAREQVAHGSDDGADPDSYLDDAITVFDVEDVAELMVPPSPVSRARQLYVPERRKMREVKFRGGETHRVEIQVGGPCWQWRFPGGAGVHGRLASRSIRPDGTVRSSYVNWYSAKGPVIERQVGRKRRGRKPLYDFGAMDDRTRQARRRALKTGVPFVVEEFMQKDSK